jgi:deoxyribonuclease-1
MLTLLLLSLLAHAEDLPPYEELIPDTPSFTTAKKRMYKVHGENSVTLYCGCPYQSKTPELSECGLGEQSGLRWERTEAEHVVPASAIGATRPCWEEGGRSHCEKEDPVFKAAHADLHNLWPAVGGINGARSNKAMGLLDGDDLAYGSCDFEVDEEGDRVEPRPEVRGDIARIYFYMEWMYAVPISAGQRRLLLHWHQTDPVDDWERKRDELIEGHQGNSNPFVR